MAFYDISFDGLDLLTPIHVLFEDIDIPMSRSFLDVTWDLQYMYFGRWNETIDDKKVREYNFKDLRDFKKKYVYMHIWYIVRTYSNKTFFEVFTDYHTRIKMFYPKESFPEIPSEGHIVKYLMSFDIKHLMVVGTH